jgi:2-phospho-L-lactate guanylyltransferase
MPPVLVPVNRLSAAKGRLSAVLDRRQRAELAMATLRTVLDAVAGAGGEAIVLTADEEVVRAVRTLHRVQPEAPGLSGLNSQLEHAFGALELDQVLILHADLPLATPAALQRLVAATPPRGIAMVESGDGGTNAMLLRPPGLFPLRYGAGSAAAHAGAALAAGLEVVRVESRGLALDLDTESDLRALLACEQGRTSAAGRLLRSWGFEAGTAPVSS